MAVAVAITNLGYTAGDLRRRMSKERDGEVVRRLSALALVLEGHSRTVTHAALPRRIGAQASESQSRPIGNPQVSQRPRLLVLAQEALPASMEGKAIEVWFSDEARVWQKGSIERRLSGT